VASGKPEPGSATATPSWVLPDVRASTMRGERTRQRIIKASRQLVEKKPYDKIAVSEIAARSRTSVGTFYRYFESKEALLLSLLSEAFWDMYRITRGMWDRNRPFLDNLVATTETYLGAYWDNRKLLKSASEAAEVSPDVRQLWASMRGDLYVLMASRLQEDQAASSLTPLDHLTTTRALTGMIDSYAHRAFSIGEFGEVTHDEIGDIAQVLARIWCRAIFGADEEPLH
jgi:AcrR family transcriptional regulator